MKKGSRSLVAACLTSLSLLASARAQVGESSASRMDPLLPDPQHPAQIVRMEPAPGVSVRDQLHLSSRKAGVRSQRLLLDLRAGSVTARAMTPVARGNERSLYSNTLGTVAIDFGANRLISDDITITSIPGCNITRFAFELDGRVSEALAGGAYMVTWALYTTCPYAVTAGAPRNSRMIPGTAGSLMVSDDAPMWLEVIPANTVSASTHMWLGVQFSRANVGVVMGAPPMVGNSSDAFDFPGSACSANFGGFPNQPHGSFNVEVWGDDATCPETYVAYRNLREAGAGINAGSVSEWVTDDIAMQNACVARGYTVGVRAPGTYHFELRPNCAGAPISGTQFSQIVGQGSGQEPRVFEYLFPAPVNLPLGILLCGKRERHGRRGHRHRVAGVDRIDPRLSGEDARLRP